MTGLDPLGAKKTFIRKKCHSMVSATRCTVITIPKGGVHNFYSDPKIPNEPIGTMQFISYIIINVVHLSASVVVTMPFFLYSTLSNT